MKFIVNIDEDEIKKFCKENDIDYKCVIDGLYNYFSGENNMFIKNVVSDLFYEMKNNDWFECEEE